MLAVVGIVVGMCVCCVCFCGCVRRTIDCDCCEAEKIHPDHAPFIYNNVHMHYCIPPICCFTCGSVSCPPPLAPLPRRFPPLNPPPPPPSPLTFLRRRPQQ